MTTAPFVRALETLRRTPLAPLRVDGRVDAIVGQTFEVAGLPARIGAVLSIERAGAGPALAEVVGFRRGVCIAMPLTHSDGVACGARATEIAEDGGTPLLSDCRGRVLDGLARPLDGGTRPRRVPRSAVERYDAVLDRARIDRPLDVGVRAINGLHTIGRGARIGIFAGSGVGKSTLLGQIARFTQADAVVVALVGERRREVREFVERELGDALGRSTVIVATSDEPAVLRRRAGILASEIASGLARDGQDVLLLMDSVTRFCTAQREIGLAAGEPPATRGYPPSVWSLLPQLLERAGTTAGKGSVTGIYTVLVEGDDFEDPVADTARSLLDGHIVLSRAIAESGAFPAIDPLASLSRVMGEVVGPDHLVLARRVRALLSVLADAQDLIRIGAYSAGSDPRLDAAVAAEAGLRAFLAQSRDEGAPLASTLADLQRLVGKGTL